MAVRVALPLVPPGMNSVSPSTSSANTKRAVGELITRAGSYPCSAAPPAFSRLATSTTQTSTFQLALDTLLPVLDAQDTEVAPRIIASFILFGLYAPHPIALNPFKSALIAVFLVERQRATDASRTGGVAENEPLVWVLWKILKGQGDDIGPYTPSALARSQLPPELRATNLFIDQQTDLDGNTTPHESPPRTMTPAFISPERDAENAAIAQAMRLLLAARTRVLTLSEQRQLDPHLAALSATPLITQSDLASVCAYNPNIAATLFCALLAGPTVHIHAALTTLVDLPPTLPTFDVLGRLLRDETPLLSDATPSSYTVGAFVRAEVLGAFISRSIAALERAEAAEREGRVSVDLFAQGVQHLCRFYHSLCKLGLVNVTDEVETAAMTHFSLVHARFEEANVLYRALVGARS
ncbi:hypothetical protein MKEN_00947000 [Mycena kentingensis (nom. inval.)]|nr:hypothetical protein MKEN_00947000 [Mycena kentingensis (nom. inval.)]